MNIPRRHKASLEFSMATMADIVFQLLIFFVLIMVLNRQAGLKVDLPKTQTGTSNVHTKNIVTVNREKEYSWNNSRATPEEISGHIRSVLTDENKDNNVILLRTDQETRMQEAAYVISQIASFGGVVVIQTEKVK